MLKDAKSGIAPAEMDPKNQVQKLEQVIQKGEAFISLLGERGVNTDSVRRKVDEAKMHFNADNMSRAYELSQECIEDLIKLKEKLREERCRREEIRGSLDRYREEGFKVEVVEQLLNEDMSRLEKEFNNFIRQMAKLKSLREKFSTFDTSGFL